MNKYQTIAKLNEIINQANQQNVDHPTFIYNSLKSLGVDFSCKTEVIEDIECEILTNERIKK